MQQSLVVIIISHFFRLTIVGTFIFFLITHLAYAVTPYSSFSHSVKGEGRDIILIPGLMSDGQVWEKAADILSVKHRVHIIDIAGFGRTPTAKTNTLNKVKIELSDYISKLEMPTLIGHSLGGFLALSLAIDRPDAIDGVITVDGLPFIGPVFTYNPSTEVSDISTQANFIKDRYAKLSKEQLRAEVSGGIEIQATSEGSKKFVLDMSELSDTKTVSAMLYALMTTDLRPSMNKITAKVMLLGASGAIPSEVGKDQLENLYAHQFRSLPSAKIKVNRSSRHFIMLDDLDWLLNQIDDFMEMGHDK